MSVILGFFIGIITAWLAMKIMSWDKEKMDDQEPPDRPA